MFVQAGQHPGYSLWDDSEQDYDHGRQGRCYDSHKRPRWVSPDFGHSKSCKIRNVLTTSMLDVHRVQYAVAIYSIFDAARNTPSVPENSSGTGDGSRVPHSVNTHGQNTGTKHGTALIFHLDLATNHIGSTDCIHFIDTGSRLTRMALVQFYLVLGILFLKGAETKMQGLGRHVLAEVYGCGFDILNDLGEDPRDLGHAALSAGAEVLETTFHRFSPQGISGVVVISESHLAIHTWPDRVTLLRDVFTCGDHVDPWVAVEAIVKEFWSDVSNGN